MRINILRLKMLINRQANDGFIAIQNIKTSKKESKTVYSPEYDAGTEPNDGVCARKPVSTCDGV